MSHARRTDYIASECTELAAYARPEHVNGVKTPFVETFNLFTNFLRLTHLRHFTSLPYR